MPFGAEVLENGETRFALWASAAETVDVVLEDGSLMPTPEAWAGTSVRRCRRKGEIEERDGEAVLPASDLLRNFPVGTCWRSRADGRRFG
jgi:hypothetical protein